MRAPRLAVLALLVSACTDVRLETLGATHPARPVGCSVDLRPGARDLPRGEFADVAAGTVSCLGGRSRCLEEIRKQACRVGADVAYGFSESEGGGFTNIEARFAARAAKPAGER